MKAQTWLVGLVLVALVVVLVYAGKKSDDGQMSNNTEEDSVVGCYIVKYNQDVYTMNIKTQDGENVSGTLEFDNYQKDSSSGTLIGTYKDGLLLGEYSFQSEGMDSVMQVAFKKMGDDFVRGYGPVDAEGTHFTDTEALEFNSFSPLSLFKAGACDA